MSAPSDGMTTMAAGDGGSPTHLLHIASNPQMTKSRIEAAHPCEPDFDSPFNALTGSPTITRPPPAANLSARVQSSPVNEAISTEVSPDVGFLKPTDSTSASKPANTPLVASEQHTNIDSIAEASQDDCLFLNKLPAEMRNMIYEWVFTSKDGGKGVELRDARPPNKALLYTCKQIKSEAVLLYTETRRKYWTDTHFVITGERMLRSGGEQSIHGLAYKLRTGNHPKLQHQDIDRIQNITVTGCHDPFGRVDQYTYLHDEGIWHLVESWGSDKHCWLEPYKQRPKHRFPWGFANSKESALAKARKRGSEALHTQLESLMHMVLSKWGSSWM